MSEALGLLRRAKKGDPEAKEVLFRSLMKDGRAKAAMRGSYRGAACMEFGDIQGEFWLGVLAGLSKVREDVGDPVAHLVQRGVWQVKTAMREELERKIVQQCIICREQNRRYSYDRKCERCGETCENVYRLVMEEESDAKSYLDSIADSSLAIVRASLPANQVRVLNALLVAHHTHPESPIVRAAELLGVSRQRIHQLIQRIQDAVRHLTS